MGKMLKRMIGEDIVLEFALTPSVSRINADAGQIEQVLANLVVNARDAMQSGGKLKVGTADITLKHQDVIQMPESRLGQFVVLTVSDTGMGIPEEILNHIFEPFFTTKDKEEGTGLGLATVYGIVKQHRGWIKVESKVGKGSKFSVYLPVAAAKTEEKAKDNGNVTRSQKGAGCRVLLVEDDNGLREMMTRLLVKMGCKVEAAADAEKAKEMFNGREKEFDLLISDVVLAGQSGVELAEHVVIRKPGMRILLCSGYSDKRSRHDAIKGKGFRFLQKPFTGDGLITAVNEALK
jgi:CheY-like chemotaxis protein